MQTQTLDLTQYSPPAASAASLCSLGTVTPDIYRPMWLQLPPRDPLSIGPTTLSLWKERRAHETY